MHGLAQSLAQSSNHAHSFNIAAVVVFAYAPSLNPQLCSHGAAWATGWPAGPFSLPSCCCWACSVTVLSVRRLETRHHHLLHQANPLTALSRAMRTRTGEWTPSGAASRPSAATLTQCWSTWVDETECANTAVDTVGLWKGQLWFKVKLQVYWSTRVIHHLYRYESCVLYKIMIISEVYISNDLILMAWYGGPNGKRIFFRVREYISS